MVRSAHHAATVPVELVDFEYVAGRQLVGVFVDVKPIADDCRMVQMTAVVFLLCLFVIFPNFIAVPAVEGVGVKRFLFVGSHDNQRVFAVAGVRHELAFAEVVLLLPADVSGLQFDGHQVLVFLHGVHQPGRFA